MKKSTELEEHKIVSGELSKKLKLARVDKGLNQKTFADLLEISPQAISGWERGASFPRTEIHDQICDILEVKKDWLFSDNSKETGIYYTPFYTERLDRKKRKQSAYYPLPIFFIDKSISITSDSILCAYCKDDSMLPVLPKGSIVAIDTDVKDIENGSLYLVNVNNAVSVKQLSTTKDGLNVKSYNCKFEDIKLNVASLANGSLNIIGKVFWYSTSSI